ncbi:YaaC family protein [Aerococcaceae bacterium NML160702]|nr:YaaC family protein [Aerococcaceae bacterium NML160702]
MAESEILKYRKKPISLKTSMNSPNFKGRTVIVTDRWEYVRYFLKKQKRGKRKAEEALFYWNQAEQFYKSSLGLSNVASPLPLYYCFLNAVKALLVFKGVNFDSFHGVTGNSNSQGRQKEDLANQIIKIKPRGICSELLRWVDGNSLSYGVWNLADLLENLVFIHRTVSIVNNFSQNKEMFIPLEKVWIQRKPNKKIQVVAEVDRKYQDMKCLCRAFRCIKMATNCFYNGKIAQNI